MHSHWLCIKYLCIVYSFFHYSVTLNQREETYKRLLMQLWGPNFSKTYLFNIIGSSSSLFKVRMCKKNIVLWMVLRCDTELFIAIDLCVSITFVLHFKLFLSSVCMRVKFGLHQFMQ